MLQLSIVNFRQGTYIFVEGNTQNDRFYIIQSGTVQFFKDVEILPPVNSNLLGPGDFIGVIPCMSNHTQVESVVAKTDVMMIAVKREQYPDLIEKNTSVAMKIIMAFSQKMRVLNDRLTERALKETGTSSSERLFSIARYYESTGKYNLAVYGYYQYLKACPNGENLETAKKRFVVLKPKTSAVYLEPDPADTVRIYPKGTMIFSECQPGSEMFIIQEGLVEIAKVVNNNEVVLAVLKKGDFFGEMALLENMPRSASAVAHSDCKLSVVNRKNFNTMVSTQPQLISRLTTTLADRLWSMYRQLSNTFIKEDSAKLFDMLALQVEKKRPAENSLQLDITFADLAHMCVIPIERHAQLLENFKLDRRIRFINDKIFVNDCREVVTIAAQFRKMT